MGMLMIFSCIQEFSKHDEQPSKHLKRYTGFNPKTGQDFSCDVAYERFLGPELFFNPEIYSSDYTTPLPQVRCWQPKDRTRDSLNVMLAATWN